MKEIEKLKLKKFELNVAAFVLRTFTLLLLQTGKLYRTLHEFLIMIERKD